MYLKLGNTRLVYEYPEIDDFMIFAEVIDSGMSFERPVVIRTKDQLHVLFGQDFSDRSFLEELLDWGISLYLTRPVNTKEDPWQDGYVDLSKYLVNDTVLKEFPTNPTDNTIYWIEDYGSSKYTEKGEPYEEYIYYEDDFVELDKLPQKIYGFKSMSLNNRDVLVINNKDCNIEYINPKYRKNYTIVEDKETISTAGLNLKRIKKGYQTMAFNLDFNNGVFRNLSESSKNGSYIVIQDRDGIRHLIYYGTLPKVDKKYYSITETFTDLDDLRNKILQLGYFWDSNTELLYSKFPVQTTYFYDIPHFSMVPNYNATHDLLSELCEDEGILKFWSKTIGSGGDYGDISVNIENLGDLEYRITLSRFDYSEVFEGYIDEREGYERIDRQISYGSILAYCEYYGGDVPEGTWTLCGSEMEDYTPEMYKKSLDLLLSDKIEDNVYPDFLLIPDIHNYLEDDKEDTYLKTYESFIEYSKNLGCQFLIQNNTYGEEDKEDYEYNYTVDVENRLVYFYHGMTVGGEDRPGYYLFLRGLIGDEYSISTDVALYRSPLDDKDPYNTEVEKLEKKKCNYLIDNNIVYYYKGYQNGKNPNTSIWMRFVLGKLSRELQKNRWSYLSERMTGKLKARIEGVIGRVVTSFSIIRQVTITNYDLDYSNNLITMSMDTYISDLVNNHMKLDITINYKT